MSEARSTTGRTGPGGTEAVACLGLPGWTWLNGPGGWSASDEALTVTTDPDTDFWVRTHYGFVRDTGHALLRPAAGAFRARVTFDGRYRDQYDQAGLLLRVDGRTWVKAGVEYVDGEMRASAVVTREVSDWSVAPLPARDGEPVTVAVEREGDTVTVRYGVGDGEPRTLLRLGYFPPDPSALLGPMCASPDGRGFEVRFTDFRLD